MARTMTPSGTPRPMPILAEALRSLGRGVGEVERVVDKTDVEEAGKGGAVRDEEVLIGKEVGVREIIDRVVEASEANMVEVSGGTEVISGVMKAVTNPPSSFIRVPETLEYTIE